MKIQAKFNDKTVGVFDEDAIFVQPLARRVSKGMLRSFFCDLDDGATIVYEDWDGSYIEFKKVKHYVSDKWNNPNA